MCYEVIDRWVQSQVCKCIELLSMYSVRSTVCADARCAGSGEWSGALYMLHTLEVSSVTAVDENYC